MISARILFYDSIAMKTRKQKNRATKAQKKAVQGKVELPSNNNSEPPDPFDFGGLPKRDIKKNLGCG
jgi:hypothetical protein